MALLFFKKLVEFYIMLLSVKFQDSMYLLSFVLDGTTIKPYETFSDITAPENTFLVDFRTYCAESHKIVRCLTFQTPEGRRESYVLKTITKISIIVTFSYEPLH